jgi:peptide/nickel transport system permease protein
MRKREFWRHFKRNRMAMTGLALVLGLFVVSIFAPWLAPYDPNQIDLKQVLMPPSQAHLLGTDTLGDVCPVIRLGYRSGGFRGGGLATLIGLLVGALAVYSGWVDSILMRLVDLMLCFPFFLILAVIAVLGQHLERHGGHRADQLDGGGAPGQAEFLSLRERICHLAGPGAGDA